MIKRLLRRRSGCLQPDPGDHDHDVEPLALGTIPLQAPSAVFLVVPEGRARRVHASLSYVVARQGVLDDGGVDDEFVLRRTGAGRGPLNQLVEHGGLSRKREQVT